MKVQLVTRRRVGHLQRYGVTVRGNVTSVYSPLEVLVHSLYCPNPLTPNDPYRGR